VLSKGIENTDLDLEVATDNTDADAVIVGIFLYRDG
jgi:hypothetical protein